MDRKKVFTELRDLCKNKKKDDNDGSFYIRLYEDLEAAKCVDYDYRNSLEAAQKKYSVNEGEHIYSSLIPHVKKLSFNECCSMITFLLRAERWSGGWIDECLGNGELYALLSRACETL